MLPLFWAVSVFASDAPLGVDDGVSSDEVSLGESDEKPLLLDQELSGRLNRRWGRAQGLMAGVTVMHGVQPLAAGLGDIAWKDKYYVGISGAALYGATTVGLILRQRWSPYVAIWGPVSGLTAVATGWLLSELGVIELTVQPDTFQVVGGILQLIALVDAVWLLKNEPRWVDRHEVAFQATPNGLSLSAVF